MIDHISRGSVDLGDLDYFIIDEVDKMFTKGFETDINTIMKNIPNTSQITDLNEIDVIFKEGVKAIRNFEKEVNDHLAYFEDNRQLVKQIVKQIVDGK